MDEEIKTLDQSSIVQEVSDVVFIVEGVKFPASRSCLMLHSPVFRAMFRGGFKESISQEIPLPGKSTTGFKKFIHVTHSFEKVTADNVYDILPIAHEYQCENILEQCSDYFIKADFCVQNLAMAAMYGLHEAVKQLESKAATVSICELKSCPYFESLPHKIVSNIQQNIIHQKDKEIEEMRQKHEERMDTIGMKEKRSTELVKNILHVLTGEKDSYYTTCRSSHWFPPHSKPKRVHGYGELANKYDLKKVQRNTWRYQFKMADDVCFKCVKDKFYDILRCINKSDYTVSDVCGKLKEN